MKVAQKKLMILGAGRLGGAVLDMLSLRYPLHQYVLVARSSDRSLRRANLARYTCAQWNEYPEITFDHTNILDVDQTSELIDRHQPDVLFNATTPFPWWMIDQVPPDDRASMTDAGPGMWCALDAILPLKLAQAISNSVSPLFVNGCYPDMVNAFLAGRTGAPICGIGNLSNLIPGLRLAFAAHLNAPPASLQLRLVCHHYTSLNAPTHGSSLGVPYHLSVLGSADALSFGTGDDLPFALLKSLVPRVRGTEGQTVTTGSACTVLAALLNGTQAQFHTPGPCGLPGGYPIKIAPRGEISLDLPEGYSVDDARAVNEVAQRSDGIETVQAGSVTATPAAAATFRRILGPELPSITEDNIEQIALETVKRLNALYAWNLTL